MRLSTLAWGLGLAIALAGAPAWADQAKQPPKDDVKDRPPAEEKVKPEPPPQPDAGEGAEVKAGTGVIRKKRVLVGESDSFEPGTKVWVWSRVHGHKGEAFKYVWKRDDKLVMEKEYTATSSHYRSWTAVRVKAGSYTVEIQSADGDVLGSVAFTVGEPGAPGAG